MDLKGPLHAITLNPEQTKLAVAGRKGEAINRRNTDKYFP